jgi:hypothetical protein
MPEYAMSKRLVAVLVLTTGLGFGPVDAFAMPCKMDDLKWMQGVWRADTAERQTEERWVTGPDGVLFGSSWTKVAGKPAFIESLLISSDVGQLAMRLRHFARDLGMAMEDKDSPMTFNLASCDGATAMFEGQGNKLGERITYQRVDDGLVFTGDFLREGKPFQVKVEFHKTAD